MDYNELLKKIPNWIIGISILVFVSVVIERIYWAKQPIVLFGSYFGPAAVSSPCKEEKAQDRFAQKPIHEKNIVHATNQPHFTATPSVETKSTDPVIQQQEKAGFNFKLSSCKKESNSVTCVLMITSLSEDKRLLISDRSRLFAPDGAVYQALRIKLGSQEGIMSVVADLIADIPMKARLTFEHVNSKLTFASALELDLSEFVVQFRKVPIQ